MRRLPQSTAYTVMLKLFLSSDHVSAATGTTVAIKISKAGGAFADPNAGATNATEVSNGWYKVTLDTTDTGTLGDLVVRGTATGCDDAEQVCQVVSATTGGATNLDAAVSAVKAKTDNLPSDPADESLIIAATDSLASQISGLNNLNQSDIRNAVGLASADLDTQLATLATSAALTAVQDHGDTYWLTATGFSTSADISGAVSALEGYGDTNWATATGFSTYDGSDTAGTTTLLSRLTDTRAGYLDNLSAGAVATAASIAALPQAIWDALTSTLTTVGSIGKLLVTNIDAAISSRLASSSYTAPNDTAVLAAISGLNDLSAAEVNAEVDTAIGDAALATAASLATTDAKVDAVQAKTDQLGFSGSLVNANMSAINGTQLTGDGSAGDKFGPA